MVSRLVQDIEKALNNDLYFAALVSALTLPDICGKAEYPAEESSRKRYTAWYDEQIGNYEKNPRDKNDVPYLSGEVVYSLRCALLHEGNPNVKNEKLKLTPRIDHFVLVIEKKNQFDIYGDSSSMEEYGNVRIRRYKMNIRRLCLIICRVAETYYKENQEKFHFNYEIEDRDEVKSHLPSADTGYLFDEIMKSSGQLCQREGEYSNEPIR